MRTLIALIKCGAIEYDAGNDESNTALEFKRLSDTVHAFKMDQRE